MANTTLIANRFFPPASTTFCCTCNKRWYLEATEDGGSLIGLESSQIALDDFHAGGICGFGVKSSPVKSITWSVLGNSCVCAFLGVATLTMVGCARFDRDSDGAHAGHEHEHGHAAVTAVEGDTHVDPSGASKPARTEWRSMFDGATLNGWTVTDFAGSGQIEVGDGLLVLNPGVMLTGVSWTNDLPKTNFEVSLEAMKRDGSDFFCALTFPVGDTHCSFIVGGWGGGVVGISSIDSMDASENETTKFLNFEKNRWYEIRVRVTPEAIQAWIDDEQLVDQSIVDHRVSMRPGEIELSEPFGIANWQTTSALRNIRIRELE